MQVLQSDAGLQKNKIIQSFSLYIYTVKKKKERNKMMQITQGYVLRF